jgi:hypothetical protein
MVLDGDLRMSAIFDQQGGAIDRSWRVVGEVGACVHGARHAVERAEWRWT